MRKIHNILFLIALVLVTYVSAEIGVVVNSSLYSLSKTAIDDYIDDLQNIEGETVWLLTSYDETSSTADLKNELKTRYSSNGLTGAVFIGDLPIAMYEIENDYPNFNFGYTSFPIDLYYMDLDGSWADNAKTGSWGKTGYFDSHTGSKEAEIWISRITPSNISGYGSESEIVNAYLARLHTRMTGGDSMERKYLILGDDTEWPNLDNENEASALGYTSANVFLRTQGQDTKANWSNHLLNGYEYAYIFEHSGSNMHCTSQGYFYINDYNALTPATNVRFYNLYACSNAKYTVSNFGTMYALVHNGLISVGSTKTGSMLTYSYYNTPLKNGQSFGEAFLNWFNNKGLNDKSWFYGMTLQGAGNLKLAPYSEVSDFVKVLSPNGGETVRKTDTLEITWNSNISENVKIEYQKGASVSTIIASTESDGAYSWVIPSSISVGDYKIIITSVSNSSLTDESDNTFEIVEFTPELTVTNGSGSGFYTEGTEVTISADAAPSGKIFWEWIGDTDILKNAKDSTTIATMKNADASVEAIFKKAPITIPAKIEAEDYSEEFGAQVISCSDDGTDAIGKLYIGDWMEYFVYVPAPGEYDIKFRVNTASANANITVSSNEKGTDLLTKSLPNTYSSWNTVTDKITLEKGYQTIRIFLNTTTGFEINWFEIATNKNVVDVQNGSGSGLYSDGAVVTITADQSGVDSIVFDKWAGDIGGLANSNQSSTQLTVNSDITIKAIYKISNTALIFNNDLTSKFTASFVSNKILFVVPNNIKSTSLEIGIYNMRGVLISQIKNDKIASGNYSFPVSNLSSGYYLAKIKAGKDFSTILKFSKIK